MARPPARRAGRNAHAVSNSAVVSTAKPIGPHSIKPYFRFLPKAQGEAGAAAASWKVPDLCEAYDWPKKDAPGGGVIGIVELSGSWAPADLEAFLKHSFPGQDVSTIMPQIEDVFVDDTRPTIGANDADGEVALDIQVAAASYYVATGKPARIRVYWAKDIAPAVRRAADDGCDVFSISWGSDEANWGLQAAQDMEAAAAYATSKGMVVFAAAGDNDSSDGGPTPANVDVPAACPHVIGCGGSRKTKADETVWNNDPGNAFGTGTGGGYSTFFPMPPWQAGAPHGPGRMVPDIAANADPETGYEIVLYGKPQVIGGTSAVAPLYAGLFGAFGTGPGFITPELWLNHLCFNDIHDGDNGKYRARIGPDPCTGMGSPIGSKLDELFLHTAATAARLATRQLQAENRRLRAEIDRYRSEWGLGPSAGAAAPAGLPPYPSLAAGRYEPYGRQPCSISPGSPGTRIVCYRDPDTGECDDCHSEALLRAQVRARDVRPAPGMPGTGIEWTYDPNTGEYTGSRVVR
jgi:kumamolisin